MRSDALAAGPHAIHMRCAGGSIFQVDERVDEAVHVGEGLVTIMSGRYGCSRGGALRGTVPAVFRCAPMSALPFVIVGDVLLEFLNDSVTVDRGVDILEMQQKPQLEAGY